MRTLTTLSIAALGFAVPSIALAQDPAEPAQPTDPAVQEALESAKKEEGAATSSDDGDRGGSRLPVSHARRPLTLTEMTLAPSLGFSVLHVDFGRGGLTVMSLDAGAKFGITDDIEVEAVPLSFVFGDPNFQYGIGRIGGTYRFLKDDFEMGATASVNFGDGFWAISAGVPMRLHLGEKARLDAGAHLYVGDSTNDPADDVAVGLAKPGATSFLPDAGIPVAFAYNFIDELWAGARTGFGVASFGEFEDSVFVPLGLDVGGTIPYSDGRGPMVDVGASFGFPYFVNSLTGDGVNPELWQLGIHARGYFFL